MVSSTNAAFKVLIEVPGESLIGGFSHRIPPVRKEVEVEAHNMDITTSGALVLSKASGQVVRAFPSGVWFEVIGK